MCFTGFDGLLYYFPVRFCSNGASAAGAAGTSGTAYAVEVNLVGLGGFVVYDCGDGGDVEAAGGEVGGEEVGCLGGTEGS